MQDLENKVNMNTLSVTIEKMPVSVYDSNAALGRAAAADFADIIKDAVKAQGEAAVIFATGNSQLSFLKALSEQPDIPWSKISAFHMDEYVGMSEEHPASFRR